MKHAPTIALLGICERATHLREGGPALWKYNLLGLKQTVVSHLFPLNVGAASTVLAIYDAYDLVDTDLRVLSASGDEVLRFGINVKDKTPVVPRFEPSSFRGGLVVPSGTPTWSIVLVRLPWTVMVPGKYRFVITDEDGDMPIGQLDFLYAPAPPLTPDRIAAIRSDPRAMKWYGYSLTCNVCKDECRLYAGLGRSGRGEGEGWTWYQDLPPEFVCKCRKRIDLTYLKESAHFFLTLERVENTDQDLTQWSKVTRLYERSALEDLRGQLLGLLSTNASEQDLQAFFERNFLLLHRFAPKRVFPKGKILTKFVTDFAVLSQNGELLLIELERPGMVLLRGDGGDSAELTHAIRQVGDWLHEVELHRLAVLDCLGLSPDEVTRVRGVVIAGRDSGVPDEHVMRMKWMDRGHVSLFSYDDIVRDVEGLVRDFDTL